MMNLNSGVLSVVVLTRNSMEHLQDLFDSIDQQTTTGFDLVVSDNGSTDGTIDWLKERGVRVMESGKNLGFSGGNNIAIRKVDSKYTLLLNDDMKLDKDSIKNMINAIETSPETGIIQGKILSWDGSKIDMVGTKITYGSMIARRGAFQPASKFNEQEFIDSAGAGGVLYKTSVLKALGGFDETFNPIFYEDADLSFRFKKLGHKILYVPTAVFYHKHGATASKMSKTAALSSHRNRYRLLKKHWTTSKWLKALPFLPLITLFYTFKLDSAYFKATYEFLSGKLDKIKWEPDN